VEHEGRRGIDRARSEPPAVLIVDLVLPDMTGFEIIDDVVQHERTRSVPIVVLSAATLSDDESRWLRARVRAVATKGDATRQELLAMLDRAVHGRAAAVAPVAQRGRVLVVDDHALNRELARAILEGQGYSVCVAEDGVDGVEAARREKPDLVLMDLAMPRLDGFAAMRQLKADPTTARIPIVALTALAMKGDEQRARDAGADAYVTKPIDRKELTAVVARWIAHARMSS
jgi:CheY-like chemotaxis protein